MKINFYPVDRSQLFFDQYRYSICFTVPDASCLRAHSVQEVLKNIQWRNESRRRWNHGKNIIDDDHVDLLLHVWSALAPYLGQIKFTTSYNTLYVYGNDPAVLTRIAGPQTVQYAQQALITRPKDVVIKANPRFALRSYFRDRNMEQADQHRLREFLENRPDSYGFTATFRLTLNRDRWFYLQRHQWIEHNSMADITMLSLVLPGIIRKTIPVQAK